jgi:hypothetical protein
MNVPLSKILKGVEKQINKFDKKKFIQSMKEKHELLNENYLFIEPKNVYLKLFNGDLIRYTDGNFLSSLFIIIDIKYKKEKDLETSMINKYIDYLVVKIGEEYKNLYINNYFIFKYLKKSQRMKSIQKIMKIKNDDKNEKEIIDKTKNKTIDDVFNYVDNLVKKHEKNNK